jgi:hypothetical protein
MGAQAHAKGQVVAAVVRVRCNTVLITWRWLQACNYTINDETDTFCGIEKPQSE